MTELAAVKAAIRAKSDHFEACFDNGDAAGLVEDYYVADPIMSAPDAPLLRGRAQILGLFEAIMQTVAACKLEQVEVRLDRDLAYEVSTAVLTMKDKTAGPAECRYMIAWRRTADGWRVETDFFSYGKLL